MSVKVRFAPSPTGKMHIGNVRTAIMVWLFAKRHKGQFLLRIDDTDLERSKDEHTESLKRDLQWLGIGWDLYAHQRDRMAQYEVQIERLKKDGRLYACYETADELDLKRKVLLSRKLPPVYDREGLSLTAEQKAKYEAEGRKPHWRFKLNHTPIVWHDLVRGDVKFDGAQMSDPVLIREDGSPLYHLCSVIDDVEFGITHIVRGEDHVSNTASHIQMFEALGAKVPTFAHLPLISDADGAKLSKRIGSLSIEELRENTGLEPMSIISLLGRLGTSLPIEAYTSPEPLIADFDFKNFSRSTPKFDTDELVRLNGKIMHALPFSAVKDRLEKLVGEPVSEEFWLTVRPNISMLCEFKDWWNIVKQPVAATIEPADKGFLQNAAQHLPNGALTHESWKAWVSALKTAYADRKGKALFMPLRQALTGMDHGPELDHLLPLIGRDEIVTRLSRAAA